MEIGSVNKTGFSHLFSQEQETSTLKVCMKHQIYLKKQDASVNMIQLQSLV